MSQQVSLSALIAPVFYPAHIAVKDRTHNEIWLPGGRGSGKSSFVSLEIVMGMLRDPEANAIIFRKVGETLRDTVYTQMVWAIEKLGVSHLWRYGYSPLEMTYTPTGQRVMFRGTDNAQKSKGLKLKKGYFKFLWFEELAEFTNMNEIETVRASVIRGSDATVFYSYNPPMHGGSWVNEQRLKPTPRRLVVQSSYLDVPPEWLGDSFIAAAEAMKASNERSYRWMYLGEVTGTGGNVFANLEIRAVSPDEWGGFPIYNGHDFGFSNDPDATIRCAFDKKRRALHIIGEFVSPGMSLSTLAGKMKGLVGREVITADSEDPRGINELRAQGIRIMAARKGPGSVERGIKWLQTLTKIIIDPRVCPHAASEFQRYEYDRDKEGNFIPRYPDKGNHCIDATRYAMESVIVRNIGIAAK